MIDALRTTIGLAAILAAGGPVAAQDRMTTGDKNQFAPDSASAPSDNPAARKTKELLAEGYEIKAFAVVPRDIVKAGGSTLDVDAVMIILQKGEFLANCYVTYASFADGSYYNGSVAACTVLQ